VVPRLEHAVLRALERGGLGGLRQRVGAELEKRLPFDVARDLQVRVYQLSPNANFRSEP